MTNYSKRWEVSDQYGNSIYLTHERWQHITDKSNHPEMDEYEEFVKLAIKKGKRKQVPLDLRKYRYYCAFDDLPDDVNHIVVIVLFGLNISATGQTIPNNFVLTAFFKYMKIKR
jgi:hypothetical protein